MFGLHLAVAISCYWGIKGCFWAWKLWLPERLCGNRLDIPDMTALTQGAEGSKNVQSCLKEKKNTFWCSERMINTFTESWLLDTWEPLCQVILLRKGGYTVCTIMCEVWFGYTRGRVALEASFYADPPQKRITGFAALSSHPDGIQGSSDSPEQALQSLCQPQISLT